jgi:hypothetical protein
MRILYCLCHDSNSNSWSVQPVIYEGESVNRSQMDIKHEICDILTWGEKHLFLDMSSTNTDTLVPIALPTCRNPQDNSLLTLCLSHFRAWSGIICDFRKSSREFLDPVVNRFTRQTLLGVNMKHFVTNILFIESFCPQERITKRCSSVIYSSPVAILTTETTL